VFEGDFLAETGAEVPHLVGPLLELEIVSDAAFESECLVLGAARRLARAAGIASFAVLDYFRRALEGADLADSRDISSVPFHFELEVLVRVESLRLNVHTELCHGVMCLQLRWNLSGNLLQFDD